MDLLGEIAEIMNQMENNSEITGSNDTELEKIHDDKYKANYHKIFDFFLKLRSELEKISLKIDTVEQMRIAKAENLSDEEILILDKIMKFVESVEITAAKNGSEFDSRRGSAVFLNLPLARTRMRKSSYDIAIKSGWKNHKHLPSKEIELEEIIESLKTYFTNHDSGDLEKIRVFNKISHDISEWEKGGKDVKNGHDQEIANILKKCHMDEKVPEEITKYYENHEVLPPNLGQNERSLVMPVAVRPNSMRFLAGPDFPVPLKDLNVPVGSTVTMTCNVTAYPAAEVIWYKNNQLLGFDPSLGWVETYNSDTGQCTIFANLVSKKHEGVYFCKARNHLGCQKTSALLTTFKNKILESDQVDEKMDFLVELEKEKFGFCGESIKLEFEISGKPDSIHWYFNQNLLFVSPGINIVFEQGEGYLELKKVNQKNSGIYQVIVNNEKQLISSLCNLKIQGRRKSVFSDSEVEYED